MVESYTVQFLEFLTEDLIVFLKNCDNERMLGIIASYNITGS